MQSILLDNFNFLLLDKNIPNDVFENVEEIRVRLRTTTIIKVQKQGIYE